VGFSVSDKTPRNVQKAAAQSRGFSRENTMSVPGAVRGDKKDILIPRPENFPQFPLEI
jgi:hypothetical protein